MTAFIRLLDLDAKDDALRGMVAGGLKGLRFDVRPDELRVIPSSPFAYWLPNGLRKVFQDFDAYEAQSDGHTTKCGLGTLDDFRFLRLHWEHVQLSSMALPDEWVNYFNGGVYSPFYDSFFLDVNWRFQGREVRAFVEQKVGSASRKVQSVGWYFKPGFVFPRRTRALAPKAMPAGGIFSTGGQAGFAPGADLLAAVALLSARVPTYLISLVQGRTGDAAQYEVGLVARVPYPKLDTSSKHELGALGRLGWSARRSLDTTSEVSHAFVVPAILQVDGTDLGTRATAWAERVAEVEAELGRVQSEIDKLCFALYGISEEDRLAIAEGFGIADIDEGSDPDSDSDHESEPSVELDPAGLAAALVSWAVGVAVGRFDVRLANGEREWPAEPDPFDPLPLCSPGMLTGDDGHPMSRHPEGYPIGSSPVLVEDPGHELDLAARVRAVFDVVFGDQADAWWSDVGVVLDSKTGVEGWLRRGFFDHHLKTYSKSRRKAPVMWPIGTASGSYRVWLYAHQVTDDTLFRVLGDVVEPKLAAEQRRLSDLTQEFGPSPSASQRRGLAAQQSLVDELIALRDQLRAVAPLWSPDLNDGIVIVLSPLWRLFAHHRAWSKELKDRWGKLAKGEYDWAQLAMHIWPERVIPKCAADRSLAIAHDLENTFWAQDATNADKWHPRRLPTTPIDQLIAERTNPTIDAARNHPNP